MKSELFRAGLRGDASHDWLTTHHSFSFASYYDSKRMGFGALRVLNDDVIAPGTGFGRHHHDNMEIITIPLAGALRHEDSMGNGAVITPGEVQVMSAGTGVEHAEFNASTVEPLSLLQIWIESARHDIAPRYDQKRFDPKQYHNTFFEVVGNVGSGELTIYQDAHLALARFDAGQEAVYPLHTPNHGVYFFVIAGAVTIAGVLLKERDALAVSATPGVTLHFEQATFLLAIEVPLV